METIHKITVRHFISSWPRKNGKGKQLPDHLSSILNQLDATLLCHGWRHLIASTCQPRQTVWKFGSTNMWHKGVARKQLAYLHCCITSFKSRKRNKHRNKATQRSKPRPCLAQSQHRPRHIRQSLLVMRFC